MATKKKAKLRKPTSDPTSYMPNAGSKDDPPPKDEFCDEPLTGWNAIMKAERAKKKAMMQKEGYGKRTKKAED